MENLHVFLIEISYIKNALDSRMKITPKGKPYWYARDLMIILGYTELAQFQGRDRES